MRRARGAAAEAPAPLTRFDPRFWHIAVHYRAGDVLFNTRAQHRMLHPGYYNATLRAVLGALAAHGVPGAAEQVHLFSQGPTAWFAREGFFSMLDGTGASLELWAGKPNSTADDMLHLASADVLVMGRSTMSVAVASLTSGVVVLNGWSPVDGTLPHQFAHRVPWRSDGTGPKERLLRQIALADSENGIGARRKKACAEAPRTPITPAAVKAAAACAA